MAFLAGFVKGFADRAVSDADAQRERTAEMDDWERKQLFMQKLEENAAKRKPVGSRFENGKMVYFNAYGESVFEREASQQEMLATQASDAEAKGMIYKNDPERLKQADEEARLTSAAQRNASNASAASAMERARTERYTRTKQVAEDNIPLPPGGVPSLPSGVSPGRGRGAMGAATNPFSRVNNLSDNYRDILMDRRVPANIKQEIADAQQAIAMAAAAGDQETVAQLEAMLAQSLAQLGLQGERGE